MAGVRTAGRLAKPVLYPSPGLGAWLNEVGGTLAFSTYQSGRLFLLGPGPNGTTVALERIVGSAMGLAVDRLGLWVSNKEQIWRFSNVGPLAIGGSRYDAVFMPRKGYLLGGCDTHDILAGARFGGTGYEVLFVNTNFSCIAAIDAYFCFRPVWKPDFISALSAEDRCHLNGMCARDGELAYATMCGRRDDPMGWRQVKNGGGCVVEVATQRVVCDGLAMPHSPRWHDGRLWLLDSGAGRFGYIDPAGDAFVPVATCPGFARGLTFVGRYAVIALSRLRDNSFGASLPLPDLLAERGQMQRCGLVVIDSESGRLVHWLTIEGGVTELFDVAFLPNILRPFTPGFGDAELQRGVAHVPPGLFPYASPRPGAGHGKKRRRAAGRPIDEVAR